MVEVTTEMWAAAVGAWRRQLLTLEEEVMGGFARWVGVHLIEMSREIYSRKKDHLDRSKYGCPQNKKSVGPDCGT